MSLDARSLGISKAVLLFLCILTAWLAMGVQFVHAQAATAPKVEIRTLTDAAGWTCKLQTGVINYVCTNTDGRTAQCADTGSEIDQRGTCTIFNADGSTVTSAEGGGQIVTETKDANGNSTGKTVEETDTIGDLLVAGLAKGMSYLVGVLAAVVLGIAAFFLYLAGSLFNLAVIKTVFEFGQYFGASDGMLIAWRIIRDIGNIVLLFGFIFMGVATILNTHATDEFSARRALPSLIIFAILLNFSLFASQMVIDVSNSFAAVFTAQAGYDCTNETGDPTSQSSCSNVGIAGNIVQMAGISSIYSISNAADFFKVPERHAPVYLGLAIFVTITAVVLLAAAIMLVIRAVVLCLLMVTSPIGFAGMAIPPLQEFANKWWKSLLSNAFFAPVYLLMVLISLKIVEGLAGNQGSSFADQLIHGDSNAPQIIVIFTVVIAFMIASLTVAKSMGAAGASFATKTAGNIVMGGMGAVGQRTVGRASYAGAQALRKTSFARSGMGKMFVTNLDKVGKSSFDMRATPLANVAKSQHLDIGTAKKGGYEKILHDAEEERVKYSKTLKNTTGEKTEKKNVDAEIETKKIADRAALSALDVEHRAQLAPLEEQRRERQREVAEARARGDAAALATAELGLNNVTRAYDEMIRIQLTARKQMENDQKSWMDARDAQKKAIDQAPQREYADSLHKQGGAMRWVGYDVTAGPAADHHAYEKIIKELNKNDTQKIIDALTANTAAQNGGGGGGAHGGGGDGHAAGDAHAH